MTHHDTADELLLEDESGRLAHRDNDVVQAVMSVSRHVEALAHAVLAVTEQQQQPSPSSRVVRAIGVPDGDLPRTLNYDSPEPLRGSVLMVHGLGGAAFQRYYEDGMYYRVGSPVGITFATLIQLPDVVLVLEGQASTVTVEVGS